MSDILDNVGHRDRLRNRLLKSGKGSLPDYELLEIVLFNTKPRQDTKPLAKRLLKFFGSLGKIMSASEDELLKIEGMSKITVSTIRAIQEISERMLKDDLTVNTIISSWKSLLDYCKVSMGNVQNEQFRVLYLNKKNILIADELQEYGTIDAVSVYPREIAKKALYLNASSIILVHNHPTGDTNPSQSDLETTKKIIQTLAVLDILVHDHIIISNKNHFSFKSHGLI